MIGSAPTEASAVTKVSAFRAPCVDTPSRLWNIQKKLLFTCRAKSAPAPMARPTTTDATPRVPSTGFQDAGRCDRRDRDRADREVQQCRDQPGQHDRHDDGSPGLGREQAAELLVEVGSADDRAQRAADARDQQDLTGRLEAAGDRLVRAFAAQVVPGEEVGVQHAGEEGEDRVAEEGDERRADAGGVGDRPGGDEHQRPRTGSSESPSEGVASSPSFSRSAIS